MSNAILAAVRANFDQQLEALKLLVDQPSHTYAREDVEQAALLLDDLATQTGLTVERHAATDPLYADHRVYSTPDADDRALALVGHVDTVHPRSSGFLEYTQNYDVIRGPGALDMKSGLTLTLFALRAVRQVHGDYAGLPVKFICVTDEEVGSPTSRDLYDELAPSLSAALIFEKGRKEDRVITSRKGGGTFHIHAAGRAAHAGNAHAKGVSAVHALALLVPQLEAITDYDRGITVNTGMLNGGTAKNTVPGQAEAVLDVRFVHAADESFVREALQAVVSSPMPERLRDIEFTLSGQITRPPMEATAEIQALRAEYEQYAAAVGLGIGEAPRQGGFSDSNLLAALGVPTIDGLGAWGEGAHTLNEWLSAESLLKRTEALALFLDARRS
jgi:glutamate carboxypeptidase